MGNQSVKSHPTENPSYHRAKAGSLGGGQPSTRTEGMAYSTPEPSFPQQVRGETQDCREPHCRDITQVDTRELHGALISEAALFQNLSNTHAENAGNIQRITDELIKRHFGEVGALQNKIDDLIKSHACEVSSLQERIHEIMGTILSSVDTSGITTRDDSYFRARFTSLADDISTFMLYLDESDLLRTPPPQATREWLEACSVGYEMTGGEKIDFADIEGAITEQLHERIFRSDLVFKIRGLADLGSHLGGTDLEKRKWRSQTVKLIIKSDAFMSKLQHEVDNIFHDIKDHITHLVRPKDPDKFFDFLRQAIENAANVELDISAQISQFESYKIAPKTRFNDKFMDNQRWRSGKNAMRGSELFVQAVVTPPILRRGFDKEGGFLTRWIAVHQGSVVTRGSG